jgi:hypothetical protein
MEGIYIKNYEYRQARMCFLALFADAVKVVAVFVIPDWVFQTGRFAPGSTRNDWGTSRPCLFPPMAVKSKPPAVRVVVDSR